MNVSDHDIEGMEESTGIEIGDRLRTQNWILEAQTVKNLRLKRGTTRWINVNMDTIYEDLDDTADCGNTVV